MLTWRRRQKSLFEAPTDQKKFTLNQVCTVHNRPRKFLKAKSVKFKTKHHEAEDEVLRAYSYIPEAKSTSRIPAISKLERFKEKKFDADLPYSKKTNDYLCSDFKSTPQTNGVNQGHSFRPLNEPDGYQENFPNDPKVLALIGKPKLELVDERPGMPVDVQKTALRGINLKMEAL